MKIKVNVDLVSNTTERKEEKILAQNNWKVIIYRKTTKMQNMSIYFPFTGRALSEK